MKEVAKVIETVGQGGAWAFFALIAIGLFFITKHLLDRETHIGARLAVLFVSLAWATFVPFAIVLTADKEQEASEGGSGNITGADSAADLQNVMIAEAGNTTSVDEDPKKAGDRAETSSASQDYDRKEAPASQAERRSSTRAVEPATADAAEKGLDDVWLADGPPTPKDDVKGWFTASDYPPEAIRGGMQGSVSVALRVEPNGKATACSVTSSSGHALLDRLTCDLLLERGRFWPARTDGKAVVGAYPFSTKWELPSG